MPSGQDRGNPSGPTAERARTLQSVVADWVHSALLTGQLRPGDRVSPEGVAHQLGVSHIPVREALQVLEGQGAIQRQPRRGFFIPQLTAAEVESVHHWIAVFESEAYRMALPLVTASDLEVMAALYRALEDARARGDIVAYSRAHRRFHFTPLDHLPNRLPGRFLEYLWDVAERHSEVRFPADRRVSRFQAEHLRLLAAFRAHDTESALNILERHRRLSRASD